MNSTVRAYRKLNFINFINMSDVLLYYVIKLNTTVSCHLKPLGFFKRPWEFSRANFTSIKVHCTGAVTKYIWNNCWTNAIILDKGVSERITTKKSSYGFLNVTIQWNWIINSNTATELTFFPLMTSHSFFVDSHQNYVKCKKTVVAI